MSSEQKLNCITRIAGADLSAAQYRFVEPGAGGTVTRVNAAGEAVLGVLQNNPGSGQAATVALTGSRTKLVAGAALSENDDITTDNQGRAITAASGHRPHGIALEAAAAAGDIISVLLVPRPVALA